MIDDAERGGRRDPTREIRTVGRSGFSRAKVPIAGSSLAFAVALSGLRGARQNANTRPNPQKRGDPRC